MTNTPVNPPSLAARIQSMRKAKAITHIVNANGFVWLAENELLDLIRAHEQQPAIPESQIPKGWWLFSARRRHEDEMVRITIARDREGMAWWKGLSVEEKELAEFYLTGHGNTLNEAIADAVAKIGGLVLDRGTA